MNAPSPTLPPAVFDSRAFADQLAASGNPVSLYKEARERVQAYLDDEFRAGRDIGELIRLQAQFIDQLLTCAWSQHDWPADSIALIAVGGYGRGELHPHSDIDLLLLLRDADREPLQPHIESFLTRLWDTGLQVGHSARTITECRAEAEKDITIATNLMESRLLAGPASLHRELMAATGPDQIWPSREFFRAKWDEQIARHRKFANTEYNLEPNVKSSPGGLRDIQMIGWVAKRHFGAHHMEELIERGFLLKDEAGTLTAGQHYLWRVRYALHMITGREEDRLLFDHQRTLATMFGFEDDDARLAVEQFMQQYYRWALRLSELNDVLMQHFDEAILRACEPEEVLEINPRFRVRNGYLEVTNDRVFEKQPAALMEVFVLTAHHSHIFGVRAQTIRLIRDNCHRIDEAFRSDPRNTRAFMDVLRSPQRVALSLRRMQRFGVLGRYLPEFGRIIGRMQHDLFHIYSVDAHTLEVVKNMRRFQYHDYQKKFPVASRIVKRLPKIELLYIAGLYHDIAKGRGGDHSELGAEDARAFCRRHHLNRRDTNLVCWLVENHLLMSAVAQRKDISDPDVIQDFALTVGDQQHLDYLYTLTVADITATNPTLWNNWRASLLRQLYAEAVRALRRGLENPVDKQDWIEETQEEALEQLAARGFSEDEVRALWANIGEDYFLRERAEDIVWHTDAIAQHTDPEQPLILVKESSRVDFEGATQIFVHNRLHDTQFAVLAAALEQLNLNIQDARIYDSGTGFSLDTFYVLDADGQSIGNDPERIKTIKRELEQQLQNAGRFPDIIRKRTPRQMRLFSVPTETAISTDYSAGVTVLEVRTPDRPGLLARIGKIFLDYGVQLQNAKITTLGERVEDVFFISDAEGKPIEDPQLCQRIQDAIRRELDQQAKAS